jgi:hypothetical protein
MKSLLVVILVILAPVVIGLLALRYALFFTLVAPKVPKRGIRFWINTILGFTQNGHSKLYLANLPANQLSRWPNWYLKYSGVIIGTTIVLWCVILFSAR